MSGEQKKALPAAVECGLSLPQRMALEQHTAERELAKLSPEELDAKLRKHLAEIKAELTELLAKFFIRTRNGGYRPRGDITAKDRRDAVSRVLELQQLGREIEDVLGGGG